MQKLLSALVAIVSFSSMLLGLHTTPVTAQEPGHDDPASAQQGPMVLPPGITHENVEVKGRSLIIEGDLKGSVHAVNSKVTLMPGASVEGNITLEGGSLSVAPGVTGLIAHPGQRGVNTSVGSAGTPKKGDWFGGQFCLWLLGLTGGVIVLLAAPNATSRVAETVSQQPGQSLLAGLITSAAMFAALAVSGMIMHANSIISLLWMPVMILIVLVSLFLLVFGWLAGMRRVGDMLAHRFGKGGSGTFYGRMMVGLTAFFAANALLGGINSALGAVGLLVEFAVALMGIGAIVRTGFGRDDEWLGRRFGRSPGGNLG